MLRTVLFALLLLIDPESRANAHALMATNAATGPRGGGRQGRFARYLTPAPISSMDAAREPASPGAKWFSRGSPVIVIGASAAVVILAVVLLTLLL